MTPHDVLVVEDSVTAALALCLALKEHGIPNVVHVTTLDAAETHLRSHKCELVVLDLMLPDASGLDGLKAIREVAPKVAIVILTGSDDGELAMEALRQGAQDFLHKGEQGVQLLRALSYAMQRNEALHTIEAMSEELRRANEELRRANEIKDQFLGMAAHDLRNPLGAILGMSRLLQRHAADKLEPKQLALLGRIRRASEGMVRLVEDLLDLSAIESGQLNVEPRETNISALVAENLDTSRLLADAKDIEIIFEDTPTPLHAAVDPRRYEQILDNLISNAIKYSPRGSSVTVRLERDEDSFVTTIRDEGQGIPAHEQADLFKPFTRTSVEPTAGENSTGLGLTIVRKIVEGHHGTIGVESEVGVGSSFIVRLPA